MREFNGLDANQAIVDFLIDCGSNLPEDARNMIRDRVAETDGLRAIIVTMETLYAVRGDAGFDTMCAHMLCDLAVFVRDKNFYGLGSRAEELRQVAQRIIDGGLAEEETDPAISDRYCPQPAPEPAPAPEPMPEEAPVEETPPA